LDVVSLLPAASANQAGSVLDTGTAQSSCTLQVTVSGTPAFSVQLQGSADGSAWFSAGAAVTAASSASLSPSPAARYFRAAVSGFTGPGSVTVLLGYSAAAGYTGGSPGAGSYDPAGAATASSAYFLRVFAT
jgi:hypothetical protein